MDDRYEECAIFILFGLARLKSGRLAEFSWGRYDSLEEAEEAAKELLDATYVGTRIDCYELAGSIQQGEQL